MADSLMCSVFGVGCDKSKTAETFKQKDDQPQKDCADGPGKLLLKELLTGGPVFGAIRGVMKQQECMVRERQALPLNSEEMQRLDAMRNEFVRIAKVKEAADPHWMDNDKEVRAVSQALWNKYEHATYPPKR